jgi:adenylate kinase
VDFVFCLDTPRDILISRLAGRRICRQCNANYHVVNIPPKRAGVCDACGGELYQRPDDSEGTVVNRLDVFARQTQPLIEYYERKGVLVRIDGGQHRDQTLNEIVKRIQSGSAS